MSLVPHTFFPRSLFDLDLWHRPFEFGPRALDIFDPFDDLDTQLNSSIDWLTRPSFLQREPASPRVPQKYRATVNCAGYDPKSIKTEIRGDKLVVSGSEGVAAVSDEDHSHRSFRKTFELPKLADTDKMTTFMTNRGGQLIIDIPYKAVESKQEEAAFWPQTGKDAQGHDQVHLDVKLPESIDPAKIQVTAKDRDIIVKVEDKKENDKSASRFYYYRRSTMPPNTDMTGLKCVYEHNKLNITAPVTPAGSAKQLCDKEQKPIAIDQQKK